MMNRMAVVIILSLILTGCGQREQAAITIGDVEFSRQEFEDAFVVSQYSKAEDGKEEFLDNFITKKLVLLEAEKTGLDRDPEFLSDVQYFWEHELLKLTLAEKNKELVKTVRVSKQDVLNYYQKHKEEYFADQEISDVAKDIEIYLYKEKQKMAMSEWLDSLKGEANVQIDLKQLGLNGQNERREP